MKKVDTQCENVCPIIHSGIRKHS